MNVKSKYQKISMEFMSFFLKSTDHKNIHLVK